MPVVSHLKAILGLDDAPLAEGLKKAGKKLDDFGDNIGKVGEGMTKLITGPIAALGAGIFAAGLKADEAMDTLRIKTGLSGAALEGLEESFRNVAGNVPADLGTISDAMAQLARRTGQTGEGLETLTERMVLLSQLTGGDLNSQIQQSTRLFGDWGIEAKDQGATLDFLFKMTQQTGASFEGLSARLVAFGGPMRQLGFSFEQAAALTAKFEKEGVNTELVMGSLRIALTRMAKEGITNSGEALSLITKKIKDAGSAGEANTLALAAFGAKAGPDMAAAIREGRFSIDELITSVNQSGESIQKAAKDTEDFPEAFARIRNQVILALEPLGNKLIGVLNNLMPHIQRIVPIITQWVDRFQKLSPQTQAVIGVMVGLAAAIGPTLIVVGKLVSAIAAIMPVASGLVAFLSGPVGWALLGVGAAIALLTVAWRKNWGGIRQATADFVAWVMPFLATAWGNIQKLAVAAWDLIRLVFVAAWDGIRTTFSVAIKLFEGDFSGAWEEFKGFVSRGIDRVVDLFTNIGPRILKSVRGLGSSIWKALTGGSDAQKASLDKSVEDRAKGITDKAASPAVQAKAKESGSLIGNTIGASVKGSLQTVSALTQSQVNDMLSKGDKKAKAAKDAAKKLLDSYTKDVQDTESRISSLRERGSGVIASLEAKYRKLSDAQRQRIIDLRLEEKELQTQIERGEKYADLLTRTNAELAKQKLLSAGDRAGALAVEEGITRKQATLILQRRDATAVLRKETERNTETDKKQEEAIKSLNASIEAQRIKLIELHPEWGMVGFLTKAGGERLEFLASQGRSVDNVMGLLKFTAQELGKDYTKLTAGEQSLIETMYDHARAIKKLEEAEKNWEEWAKKKIESNRQATDGEALIAQGLQLGINLRGMNIEAMEKEIETELKRRTELADGSLKAEKKANEERDKAQKEALEKAQKDYQADVDARAKIVEGFRTRVASVFERALMDTDRGFKGMFSSIVQGFEEMLRQMAAKYLASKLAQLFVKGLDAAFGGNISDVLGDLEGRQMGGATFSRATLVGEDGPEVVVPPAGAAVVPSGSARAAIQGGGAATMHVSITINATDADSVRKTLPQMEQELAARLRRAAARG